MAAHYRPEVTGYPEPLVHEVISRVRTDLDAFSDAEIGVLINHGYILADAAVRRHLLPLIEDGSLAELTITPAAMQIPFPVWMEEQVVRKALRDSHKVRLLGRARPQ